MKEQPSTPREITALAVMDDGQVVSGALGGEVRVWDASGASRELEGGPPSWVVRLAVGRSGRVLSSSFVATSRRALTLFDLRSGTGTPLPTGHTEDWIEDLVASEGRALSGGGADGTVRLWDFGPARRASSKASTGVESFSCSRSPTDAS